MNRGKSLFYLLDWWNWMDVYRLHLSRHPIKLRMNSTVVMVSSAKEVLSLRLLEWNFGDAPFKPAVFDSEEGKTVLEVVCVRCGVDTSKGKFTVKFDGLILQMSLLVISSLGFELASPL